MERDKDFPISLTFINKPRRFSFYNTITGDNPFILWGPSVDEGELMFSDIFVRIP